MTIPTNDRMLSIVVPFRNEKTILPSMITQHLSLQNDSIEFLYVDDGSSDGSSEELLKIHPSAVILKLNGVGTGKAFHHGATIAKGTYLLLLPMDCTLLDNGLGELLGELLKKNNRIFLFPKTYSLKKKMTFYASLQNLILLKWIRLASWTNGFVINRELVSVLEISVRAAFLNDLELSRNIRSENWCILKNKILVSPRRYEQEGAWRRILLNGFIVILWLFNLASVSQLHRMYKRGKNV